MSLVTLDVGEDRYPVGMTGNGNPESRLSRIFLFLSSLSPALAIASIRLWDVQGPINYWLLALALTTFALMPLVILFRRRKAGRQILKIKSVKDESNEIPTYFITFIFPFLFLSPDMSRALTRAYIAFAALMLLMLFRTPLSTINPALLIFKRRVFAVELEAGSIVYVVSQHFPVPTPTQICAKRILSDLYIFSE